MPNTVKVIKPSSIIKKNCYRFSSNKTIEQLEKIITVSNKQARTILSNYLTIYLYAYIYIVLYMLLFKRKTKNKYDWKKTQICDVPHIQN